MKLAPAVIAARLGLWALTLITIITGISLVAARSVEIVTDYSDGASDVEIVDVMPVGIGLLCTGILVLAAILIAEGYGRRATGSGSTPDA